MHFPSARANLLTSLVDNLKKRFADSDTGVINSTSTMDLGMWPVKEKMKAFGDKEVVFIEKHYEESLVSASVDVDSVQLEWTLLKNDLYSGNDAEEIETLSWREINRSGDLNMKTSCLSLTTSFAFLPPPPSAREVSVS